MKILKVTFAFVVCFLILNIFISVILQNYYRPTARHFASLEFLKKIQDKEDIDYLIIGDSTGLHSIKPSMISSKSFSICFSGSSLLDTYYTLTHFDLSHIKKGVVLVNSFNSKLHYGDDFWKRFILMNSYSLSELKEIYESSENNHIFPARYFSKYQFYFLAFSTMLHFNKYAYEAFSEHLRSMNFSIDFYKKYSKSYNENQGYASMEDNLKTAFTLDDVFFLEPYQEYYRNKFKVNETDMYYLEKIYQKLNKQNLKLIIPSLPLASKATKLSISSYENSLKSFFEKFAVGKKNFLFLPIEIELTRSDFFDFNHVKSTGASKVTYSLIKLLIPKTREKIFQQIDLKNHF